MTLSNEQQAAIDTVLTGKNTAIWAVAGAGKTTLLVALDEVLKNPEFLILSFSRELIEDIKPRLQYGLASTLHAWMLRACNEYVRVRNIPKQFQRKINRKHIVNEDLLDVIVHREVKILHNIDGKHIPAVKSTEYFQDFYQCKELANVVRNKAISYNSHEYDKLMQFTPAYMTELVKTVLTRMTDNFLVRAETDYTGLLYMPIIVPEIQEYIEQPIILAIDEINDSNALFRQCYQWIKYEDTQVVLVGDSAQTIHVWNGTETNAVSILTELFNCTVCTSRTTFRVPHKVIRWVNSSNLHTSICANYTNNKGKLNRMSVNKMYNILSPGDVILGRFNRHRSEKSLHDIAIDLLKLGKKIRLLGSEHIEQCQHIMSLSTNTHKNYLTSVLHGVENERKNIAAIYGDNNPKITRLNEKLDTFKLYWNFYASSINSKKTPQDFIEFLENMQTDSENSITLSSIHRSKGKTFSNVYLVSVQYLYDTICNQELTRDERIEARNLLYVAVTRTNNILNIVGSELPDFIPLI